MNNNEKLKNLLENVCDTYDDFVYGMLLAVKGHEDYAAKLIKYMKKYPEANSSEIIYFLNKLEGIPEWNPETNRFEVPDMPEIQRSKFQSVDKQQKGKTDYAK